MSSHIVFLPLQRLFLWHQYNARMLTIILTLAALMAATLSGITGLGGGTILIAVLYAVGLVPAVAVPLHAGVQLVSNASRSVAFLKHVDWWSLRWFLVGALPAPFLVAPLVVEANPDWVRLGMAGFILLALWPKALSFIHIYGRVGMISAGVLASGVGMVVGATGMLIAPFFLQPGWSKQRVIASLAVCQTCAHLLKITAFASYGFNVIEHWEWLIPMCIAVIVGTWIGRHLHGYIEEHHFEVMFRVILALLAAKLTWDASVGLGWLPF